MYKIYINETLLILSSSTELKTKLNISDFDLIVRYTGVKKFLLNYIDFAEKSPDCKTIVIHQEDYQILKNEFKSLFKIEMAAGGLVINKKGQALLIYRRGYWDLPKGKLESGEKKKKTALREVKEETGIKEVKIIRKLGTTYHTYRNHLKNRILKRTDWYLMESNETTLKPQLNEGIETVAWKKIEPFLNTNPEMYNNIEALLKEYCKI